MDYPRMSTVFVYSADTLNEGVGELTGINNRVYISHLKGYGPRPFQTIEIKITGYVSILGFQITENFRQLRFKQLTSRFSKTTNSNHFQSLYM